MTGAALVGSAELEDADDDADFEVGAAELLDAVGSEVFVSDAFVSVPHEVNTREPAPVSPSSTAPALLYLSNSRRLIDVVDLPRLACAMVHSPFGSPIGWRVP